MLELTALSSRSGRAIAAFKLLGLCFTL